jgi:hypothetical protein
MDEQIGTFCAFTDATPEQAQRFLALTDGNVEQAVELYFSNPDLGAAPAAAPPARAPAPATSNSNAPITIDDDDDEMEEFDDDDDLQETGSRPVARPGPSVEDDEAMARRLQEEMYGARGGGGGSGMGGGMDYDEDGVRAPMAARTETLVGPGSNDWRTDPGEMNAAIAHQLMNRQQRRAAPGIFNQRESRSIWANDDPSNPAIHNEVLSRATGGASDQTSKANLLAELFRPPFDLISQQPFSAARDDGKENEKWIIVNVQDPSIFDCQVLNRDIWKNQSIRDTIKEHFIFLQYNKDDPRGQEYVNYYFSTMRDSEDAYPHIAIVDPRTGEQVKTWSGSPGPKASDFLMDLHEFLDRYSLKMEKKNPVQTKRKEAKKDVTRMSEEEQMELALQASLANGSTSGPKDDDPDALTKDAASTNGKGKAAEGSSSSAAMDVDEPSSAPAPTQQKKETPFSLISSTTPHEEPSDPKTTARIQFRHSGGRVIRRFSLDDPVRRIYEWIKSEPLSEGKDGLRFELVSNGKNLIESLDASIKEAGLSGGTVFVEYVEEDDE